MSDRRPRWLTEAEVTSLLDLPAAMAAIEGALVAEAAGGTSALDKTHVGFGHGHGLHALGGVLERGGSRGHEDMGAHRRRCVAAPGAVRHR